MVDDVIAPLFGLPPEPTSSAGGPFPRKRKAHGQLAPAPASEALYPPGGVAPGKPSCIHSHPGTIVYCPTRKEVELMAAKLQQRSVCAAPYHAGLPQKHRERVHLAFRQRKVCVVVATIAFGMGIDRPDVRRVVHYGWPQSIEALHQETGRAGRDGKVAQCILFANLAKPPDLLPNDRRPPAQTKWCLQMLSKLYRYAIMSSAPKA